ncbi:type II toxin-antitoxin system RelB/DinJ family antitoxin [Lacticaseibacillus yichunensis]|uniref:Type II toxin-antitoxin system RelB/DinJ family antitoxin n=1 Tax=Lacticaseibacillus yichunensis TaxID=2486015 RepID=A0ABW4CTC9_9LACO|nr:type II toxin-antitoxin system RelB/DinJ family antitoxin [Lacticaseibacillus yichunensis]
MPTKSEDRISVRIDPELKRHVQDDLNAMGLDVTTFITMSFKELERTHTLPFTPTSLTPLEESLSDLHAGRITKAIPLEDYIKTISQEQEDEN